MNEGKIAPDATIKPPQSKAAYYGIRGGLCYCCSCCFCTLLIIAIWVTFEMTQEEMRPKWRPLCGSICSGVPQTYCCDHKNARECRKGDFVEIWF